MIFIFTNDVHSPLGVAMMVLIAIALIGATYLSSKALSFDLRNKPHTYKTMLKFFLPIILAILLGFVFKTIVIKLPYIPKELGYLIGMLVADFALYQSFRNYSNQQDNELFEYENKRISKINGSYYWTNFLYYLDVTCFVLIVLIFDLINFAIHGTVVGIGAFKYIEVIVILVAVVVFHIFSEKVVIKLLNIGR